MSTLARYLADHLYGVDDSTDLCHRTEPVTDDGYARTWRWLAEQRGDHLAVVVAEWLTSDGMAEAVVDAVWTDDEPGAPEVAITRIILAALAEQATGASDE